MLLYITGSFPDNQEGIASGAKVLLDALIGEADSSNFLLLTTDTKIITDTIENNTECRFLLMPNWKVTKANIKKVVSILGEYQIDAIHMEYPGDLYGKTFLASFLPYIVRKYNKRHKKSITFNVRLHEFSRARVLRKAAILPILRYADRIYVPAQRDREIVSKFSSGKVYKAIIGTNIKVVSNEVLSDENITLVYFGSVYPGKGIEHMLSIWKHIKDSDTENKYRFKIIGEIGTEQQNHFSEYHKQVWDWIHKYGLFSSVEVTGYVSDEDVSKEIQKCQIATVFYEDGLTLRRGSFLAFLAHGIPIVTSSGDDEAKEMFDNHIGIRMTNSDHKILDAIYEYSDLSKEEKERIRNDNIELSKNFDWKMIAAKMLKDYGMLND